MVGLLIILTAMAIVFLIYEARQQVIPFARHFQLRAIVARADAIRVGTPVTLAGIAAGEVKRLDITPDNRIRVVMEIQQKYRSRIRSDSQASLVKPLFGNPSIDISLGSPAAGEIDAGNKIILNQPVGLSDLMAGLPQRLRQVDTILANYVRLSQEFRDPHGNLQQGLAHFNDSLERFSKLASSLQQTEGELRASLANLQNITKKSADVLTHVVESQESLNQILSSGAVTLDRLERSTKGLPHHAKEVAAIIDDIHTLSRQLRTAAPQIEAIVQESRSVLFEADRTLRASQHSFLIAPHLPKYEAHVLISPPRDPGLAAGQMPGNAR